MAGDSAPLQDAGSFSLLYDRTHLLVYRFVYGLLGGPAEEAEDLTAETYLRAWNARSGFFGDENAALGWLIQIARNLVIDAHRRKKARGIDQNLEEAQLIAPDPGPEDQTADHEQFQILWKLLQTLTHEQREIVLLRYNLGWPVKRIAGHLGISENTASVNLRRILQRLQRDWPESYLK
jgi:RNA polymerase sigma-70 factor (ECF subfamily)